VAALGGRLRESVDLASVLNELTAAGDQVFEPTQVSVWLANRRSDPVLHDHERICTLRYQIPGDHETRLCSYPTLIR
jgi:hypothetical protein